MKTLTGTTLLIRLAVGLTLCAASACARPDSGSTPAAPQAARAEIDRRVLPNGRKVAEGRIDKTIANLFSPDEGATVGVDDETAVTNDYRERDNRFTGRLGKIVVELK